MLLTISKQFTKNFILKIIVKFLNRIDPTFFEQFFYSKQEKFSSDKVLSLKNTQNIHKTLIVNSGIYTDKNYLKFLIKNTLNELQLKDNEFNDILQYLQSKNIYEFNDYINELNEFCKSKIKNNSIIFFKFKMHLLKIKEEYNENKTSYLTDNKKYSSSIYWPDPTDPRNKRSIFDKNILLTERNLFLNKDTPIVSMGSCFAIAIAKELQKNKFNYIVTEENKMDNNFHKSSANWGTLFNTASFKQLVEKAFGIKQTPKILWTLKKQEQILYLDPFREDVFFNSVEDYEVNYEKHIQLARKAMEEMEVLIITPGVNEIWRLKDCKSVLSLVPWRVAPELVERHILSVEENLSNLQKMNDILLEYNKNLKIIISLSPVPLHATFLGDRRHVIEANSHSKAVLKVAIEEFVNRNTNVFYFPSYELISYCSKNPWEEDLRHVNRETVACVMDLFYKMYCNT